MLITCGGVMGVFKRGLNALQRHGKKGWSYIVSFNDYLMNTIHLTCLFGSKAKVLGFGLSISSHRTNDVNISAGIPWVIHLGITLRFCNGGLLDKLTKGCSELTIARLEMTKELIAYSFWYHVDSKCRATFGINGIHDWDTLILGRKKRVCEEQIASIDVVNQLVPQTLPGGNSHPTCNFNVNIIRIVYHYTRWYSRWIKVHVIAGDVTPLDVLLIPGDRGKDGVRHPVQATTLRVHDIDTTPSSLSSSATIAIAMYRDHLITQMAKK